MRRLGLALLGLAACGYRPAHAPVDPAGPLHVVVRALAPEAAALVALEEGARAELARAGQLARGGEGTALEIDLLRVDESAEGIALSPGAADLPLGRGLRVTVTGRAQVRRVTGSPADRDTGDVRADSVVGAAGGPAVGLWARDEAARSAARRLGERLVRRVLGVPDPGAP